MTGTDTGVGKTVVTAAITAALRDGGVDAVALKPIVTGLDEAPDPDWPPDHELLARVSECDPGEINAFAYGPPVSPHLAAEVSGRPVLPDRVLAFVRAAGNRHDAVIVEGVGGLLVPLADGCDVRTFARTLGLPVLIAARPSLGTINHTLLTLEAARSAGLEVAAVVLTPWPDEPESLHHSNRTTIQTLGHVDVYGLPPVSRPDPDLLSAAAADLPLERWR